MTLTQIQSRIESLFSRCQWCNEKGHKIGIRDGEIFLLHRKDIQKAKTKKPYFVCCAVLPDSLRHGMDAGEWERVAEVVALCMSGKLKEDPKRKIKPAQVKNWPLPKQLF